MEVDVVKLASEFPNDNPALHRGVIWVCVELTGRAQPERARSSEPPHMPFLIAADPADSALEVAGSLEERAPEAIEEPPFVAASVEESAPLSTDVHAVLEPARAVTESFVATADDVEASAPTHDSLAPPEDDEEDEAAGPIVVEELEPVEASVEGHRGGRRGRRFAEPAVVEKRSSRHRACRRRSVASRPSTRSRPRPPETVDLRPAAVEVVERRFEAAAHELDGPMREPPPPAISEVVLSAARHDLEVEAADAGAARSRSPA